jgi:hypothetical protein
MVMYLPLSQGYETIVDDEDFDWLNQWKWTASLHTGGKIYAYRQDYRGRRPKCILLHRLILSCPDDMQCDHINGNGLDNTRSNIRVCTSKQNHGNRRPNHGHRYIGIRRTPHGTWSAQIRILGKVTRLGIFETAEDAAAAYNAAALLVRGEYAYLNDTDGIPRCKSHVRPHTSVYVGVSWNRWRRLWRAAICARRKRVFLGYFRDEIDAALAYDAASLEYRGSRGRVNFK